MWKKLKLVSAEFENSKSRFVLPIALKLRERWLEVVAPAFDEFEPLPFGQERRRGKLYYLDSSVDVLLHLVEEEGRRSVRVMCRLTPMQCKVIEEAARHAWIEGASPRYVEKLLESLDLTVIT
jgi:hypothetical protein